jgi:hypothetical protein
VSSVSTYDTPVPQKLLVPPHKLCGMQVHIEGLLPDMTALTLLQDADLKVSGSPSTSGDVTAAGG